MELKEELQKYKVLLNELAPKPGSLPETSASVEKPCEICNASGRDTLLGRLCKPCETDVRTNVVLKNKADNLKSSAAISAVGGQIESYIAHKRREHLGESWDTKMKTPASKKGMFKGKTKAELRSELATLKARSKKLHDDDKPEPQSLKTKIKEVEFALRAKNSFGKVSESAINESALSFRQILAKYPNEIRAFEEEGEGITDEMFNDLYEYYVEDMPYGTAKGRTGDPYQWIEEHFLNDLGRHTSASVTEAKKTGSPLKKKRIPGPFSKKIREDIGDQDYSGGVSPENDQTGRPCMLCNTPVSWKNNYSLGPNGAVFCGKCLNADKEAVRAHWKDIPARSGRSMAPYQYGSVAEGAVHNFLDKMSAAARNFFRRVANKLGYPSEQLLQKLSALDPDNFSAQDIADILGCSIRHATLLADTGVHQGVFNENGNSYSLAKTEVTEVRVAAKVAKSKEEHPENFCKVKNCLWRTKEDFCPKHTKKEAVPFSKKIGEGNGDGIRDGYVKPPTEEEIRAYLKKYPDMVDSISPSGPMGTDLKPLKKKAVKESKKKVNSGEWVDTTEPCWSCAGDEPDVHNCTKCEGTGFNKKFVKKEAVKEGSYETTKYSKCENCGKEHTRDNKFCSKACVDAANKKAVKESTTNRKSGPWSKK